MAATLDGVVDGTGAVFEAKFMLPWSFSEEAAAEKHMARVQHNMWVTNGREAVLSIINGGGEWAEIRISADPLYQHLLLTAERKFWRCVESGDPPSLFGVEPPRARIEAMRIVDMSSSNVWAALPSDMAPLISFAAGAFVCAMTPPWVMPSRPSCSCARHKPAALTADSLWLTIKGSQLH
jgi:hypothetical protein